MATHSSNLAWEIPWSEDPGGLQSMGLQRVRQDLVTEHTACVNFLFPGGSEVKNLPANAGDLGLIPGSGRSPGEGNGNPLQCSCLENPRDGGAWWAAVYRVAQSRTQLK